MITIYQLAEWIVKHRKGNAFKDYSMAKICEELAECVNNSSMVCVTDEYNNIVGIACGYKNEEKKEFFVYDCLTIAPWVIKLLLREYTVRFPGYVMVGNRHNIKHQFNSIEKLVERL